jgi:branched-chain amino acid transport system substrate-binding protein
MAAERVLADLKSRGLTRLGLLSESAGFGKSGHDHTTALAAAHGIEIVADEVYSPKDPDVTPQLTRIRAAPGLQALFVFGTGTGPAVATRNIRQLGISVPVYQSHGVSTREFLRLVGSAAEGMRLPAGAQTVAEQLPESDPQKAVVIAFKRAFEARNPGMEATLQAGHGLDAYEIVARAIQRAGSTDKVRVRDEIERTTRYVGSTGIYTYSPTDHLGLGPDAFHLVEIRNGEWVPVD